MKFWFLGGADEVGGSSIYLHSGELKILLDAGIRQNAGKDPIPDFQRIREEGGLDAIFVSHAHMDHTGTLPIISRAYPHAPIYMTAMSADLTRVLLYDSLKIMDRREEEIPQYTEQDVRAMLSRIVPVRFQSEISFPGSAAASSAENSMTAIFYPAGHIGGAACIRLRFSEGDLFYSGDFSTFAQQTIEGARIPQLRPDIAILESTYGNRLHANRQVEEQRLVDLVESCRQQGKKILIPVFALGRAQEVLLILRKALLDGRIKPLPIYVDGMVRDINTMYFRNPTFLRNALARRIWKEGEPFYTDEIRPILPSENRTELVDKIGPAVFLSSSGMLTGGPSLQYARSLLPREDACIIITGYQDEEAPGRLLLSLMEDSAAEKRITLDGLSLPVNCRIELVGLSAHADKGEILSLAEKLSARRVFLVHGDHQAISELGTDMAADIRRQVYQPICGESYEIEIHKKRKQLSPILPDLLSREFSWEENCIDDKELWQFWTAHYPGRSFTLEQVAQIWNGQSRHPEEVLTRLQECLQKSPYFDRDPRRTFLFQAISAEDAASLESPHTWTMQELEEKILILFSDWNYKKVSYHIDRKEAVLTFDFPDILNTAQLAERSQLLEQETGWTISLSPKVNHSAIGHLLLELFGERLRKSSYYETNHTYSVLLTETKAEDAKAASAFSRQTGWKLQLPGQTADPGEAFSAAFALSSQKLSHGFWPAGSLTAPQEQNQALQTISLISEELPDTPCKVGVRTDHLGKYLALSFISPQVGMRSPQILQKMADQTGWNIRVTDSINQNQMTQIFLSLCRKYQLHPLKNPSVLAARKEVCGKLAAGETIPEKMKEEFFSKTGFSCK